MSYSTCSLRAEEDEAVVAGALADADIKKGGWRLAPALPAWPRRGRPHAGLDRAQSDCLARADPSKDATGAFFVALLMACAVGFALLAPITGALSEVQRKAVAGGKKAKAA